MREGSSRSIGTEISRGDDGGEKDDNDNDHNDDDDDGGKAVDHACGKAAVDQLELRHKLTPTADSKYQRNYQPAYMKTMMMLRKTSNGGEGQNRSLPPSFCDAFLHQNC